MDQHAETYQGATLKGDLSFLFFNSSGRDFTHSSCSLNPPPHSLGPHHLPLLPPLSLDHEAHASNPNPKTSFIDRLSPS